MWIASDGQASTQVSHSTHMSLSTHAFSLSIDIASAGHSLTHVSHPVHFSLFTTAGKFFHSTTIASDGTNVNAGLAVNAHFPVDFRFFVLYGDCRCGTFIYTGLAAGTFCGVNDCNQLIHSIVYVESEIKNRFRYKFLKRFIFPHFLKKMLSGWHPGHISGSRIYRPVWGKRRDHHTCCHLSGIISLNGFPVPCKYIRVLWKYE